MPKDRWVGLLGQESGSPLLIEFIALNSECGRDIRLGRGPFTDQFCDLSKTRERVLLDLFIGYGEVR